MMKFVTRSHLRVKYCEKNKFLLEDKLRPCMQTVHVEALEKLVNFVVRLLYLLQH